MAYQHARSVAGADEANKIIGRFGARYAATVPPQHYATAIEGLTALASHVAKPAGRDAKSGPTNKAAALDPQRVKSRWTRQAPAER